ncbi:MAG: ROK family protein [Bacilli bacterium]|jgi:glucokinase|nr:ROK family protein [Bacilli bacterium]
MKCIAVLDIGGTNIRAAVIREDLKILKFFKEKTVHNDGELLLYNVKKMLKKLELDKHNVKAISIGVAGRVRKESQIDELPNIGVKNIDFAQLLKDEFNLPIFVRNDAEMAVLAEAHKSSFSRVYFITISTGLGGAFAVNKSLANHSKEIGHSAFLYKNKLHDLESLISGSGIKTLAKINGLKIDNAQELFCLVKEKDAKALNVYHDWFNLLKQFFVFVHKTFAPEVIFVAGGFMNEKDLFFGQLKKDLHFINIVEDEFGDEVTLFGAAIYGFESI